YRHNPQDLELGFYLFQGIRPRGLTPELNQALNTRLWAALAPTHQGLLALGMPQDQAQAEITSLFAHIVGLLLLSHTGRSRMFKQDPQHLFCISLDGLLVRALNPTAFHPPAAG